MGHQGQPYPQLVLSPLFSLTLGLIGKAHLGPLFAKAPYRTPSCSLARYPPIVVGGFRCVLPNMLLLVYHANGFSIYISYHPCSFRFS